MNDEQPKSGNALIIGGGYLGTRLYGCLLKQGAGVILSDLAGERCSDPRFRANIADQNDVRQLAERIGLPGPGTIYACVSTKGGDAERCKQTYLEGMANIIEYFPSAKIVYCSSSSLYGETAGCWVDETAECRPLDEESGILLQTEQMVRRSGGVVGRLSAIYGPKRCVLLERLLQLGKPVAGAPERWLNYIHRDDAVSALILLGAGERKETLVNISDGHPMMLGEIYAELASLLSVSVPECLPASTGRRRGKTNQRVSNSLLRSYGWIPRYPSVLEGIRSIINENRPNA